MSHATKSEIYNRLKELGYQFQLHYREYSTDQLWEILQSEYGGTLRNEQIGPEETEREERAAAQADPYPNVPRQTTPTDRMAGTRAYVGDEETPVRVDPETGFVWYREEVRKPATALPRARRKITYIDSGVSTERLVNGNSVETFEVAGTARKMSEVKITMPSYQVGIYKDPRLPFKVHIYNDRMGFDLFDIHEFYGGDDMVPPEIKRVYVANDLCYDIRTTIQAINAEHRRITLRGMNA